MLDEDKNCGSSLVLDFRPGLRHVKKIYSGLSNIRPGYNLSMSK